MSWMWIFELTATVVGLAAAALWLCSATLGPRIVTNGQMPDFAGDGDELLDLGDARMLWVQNSKIAKLNAWAAGLTGVATLLQLGTFWLALTDRPF